MRKPALFLMIGSMAVASTGGIAETVPDVYRQTTLSIVVAHEPGTGFDVYARLLARHLSKRVPGAPSVIVQNMPGGGGLTAYNWLANVAPRDGSVFATAASTVPFEPLLGNKAARFKASDLQWVGSMDSSVNICGVSRRSGVANFGNVFEREVLLGSSGHSSPLSILPRALNELIGARFKVIEGYKGSSGVKLALERGEVDGICGISLATVRAQFADITSTGLFSIILQIAPEPHPDLEGVPHVFEYAKTDEDRAVFDVLFGGQALGRSFVAPPKIPAERLEALRTAFASSVEDPALTIEAEKLGLDLRLQSGAALQNYIERIYSSPPNVIDRAKRAIGR